MLSRRTALVGAGGAIFTFAQGGVSRAQSGQRDPQILEMLANAEIQAEALLDAVTEVVPDGDQQAQVVSLASSVEDQAASAISMAMATSNEDALLYVRPAGYPLAMQMLERDISFLPEEKFEFPVVVEVAPSPETEQRWDVLKDIIAQVLLGSDFSNYLQFRTALTVLGLDDLFERLLLAVRDRSWATAAAITRHILSIILSAESLVVLEAHIGQSALRQMLVRVGARFVPFIGWALLIASIVQALKDNWERLQQAQ